MNKITVLTLTILLALVGCQNPAGSTPVAPVASALFTTVSLIAVPASGATFLWTQVSGPTVSITGSTSSSASFIPTVVGTYTFNVSENGVASNSVSVTIQNPAWAAEFVKTWTHVQALGGNTIISIFADGTYAINKTDATAKTWTCNADGTITLTNGYIFTFVAGTPNTIVAGSLSFS